MDINPNRDLEQLAPSIKGQMITMAWSGGLDSNALLCALLRAGARVTAVSLDSNTIPAGNIQARIRNRIASRLYTKYPDGQFEYINVQHKVTGGGNIFDKWILGQAVMWIDLLHTYSPTGTKFIALGYVMGDDALSFLDEMSAYHKGKAPMYDKQYASIPKLVFPMAKMHKVTVAKYLNVYGPEMLKLHWSCELKDFGDVTDDRVIGYRCGKCPSCIKSDMFNIHNDPFGIGTVPRIFSNYNEYLEFFDGIDIKIVDVGGVCNKTSVVFRVAYSQVDTKVLAISDSGEFSAMSAEELMAVEGMTASQLECIKYTIKEQVDVPTDLSELNTTIQSLRMRETGRTHEEDTTFTN